MTPHQCWNACDWKTTERHKPSQAKLSLPTCTHRKAGKTILPTVAIKLRKEVRVLLSTFSTYSHNKAAQKKGRDTLVPEAHHVQTVSKFRRKLARPTPLKRTRRSRSFSLHSSRHNIPLLCHSPSTVRERLCCCDGSATELLWRCELSEQGEPNDFELTQHAPLISWQRKSIATWQLNATRPSSQSSRKSATTSLDKSCPTTSMAWHSLLCSYSSPPKEVSLARADPLQAFWAIAPPHVSFIRRLIISGPSFAFC